ncbi:hypothetical protein FYJ43_04300 [Cutibacterium sp. WCA-380-WT-3A]|uniref:Chitin-binding type-3 domain-containing protein n=1 Tax=Cutibacterium porci TaxID=2605781 RepID=A0A7K0J687_9ACTN|nr:hypothetical protein [Cutibacterium porci]MSS45278.1 hypothetical protein [Cutibacterium porci]
MTSLIDDVKNISDADLNDTINALYSESNRRRVVAEIPQQVADAIDHYQDATGITAKRRPVDGGYAQWAQPTGALDAYRLGDLVTHGGKTWESTVDSNVWEPGVANWRERQGDTVPEYRQPTGATDAYHKGDRVTFDGHIWESLVDGNVWDPAIYPPGWTQVK